VRLNGVQQGVGREGARSSRAGEWAAAWAPKEHPHPSSEGQAQRSACVTDHRGRVTSHSHCGPPVWHRGGLKESLAKVAGRRKRKDSPRASDFQAQAGWAWVGKESVDGSLRIRGPLRWVGKSASARECRRSSGSGSKREGRSKQGSVLKTGRLFSQLLNSSPECSRVGCGVG
jgi:hypothetical protein